ncbi:MAG: WD40/YVTN/BNR-like repeat-containing protein [Candidatus Binatia bacterium]
MKRSVIRLFTVALDVWTSTALTCAVVVVASAPRTHAAINLWTTHGPYGESVTALAIDPITPSTLYAGTVGGVFRSTNSGGSWGAVNTGLSDLFVSALAIDPTTPSTLYAGTVGSGVFQSTNSGASWTAVNTGLPGDIYINALAIDPATPSTLYAGTNAGVFSIQQGAVCIGDCDASGSVTVDELVMLVNVALGNAQPSACPDGVPSGDDVNISLILTAVNHALNGCGG